MPAQVSIRGVAQATPSSGCVDRYAPSGTARYAFAIPGALCRQSVAPEVEAITATDGVLTIDRGRSPATFVGHAATTWPVTWSCDLADGTTATQQFAAGGLWFEAAGEVGAAGIVGTWTEPDGDGEIDRMGRAAGLPADVDAPFAGVAEVDGRDRDRWELDPRSAEDAAARDDRAPA